MKKLAALTLIVLLIISLTACGGSPSNSKTEETVKNYIIDNLGYKLYDLRVVENEKTKEYTVVGTLKSDYSLEDFPTFAEKLSEVSEKAAEAYGVAVERVNPTIYTGESEWVGWSSDSLSLYNQEKELVANVNLGELNDEILKIISPDIEFGDMLDEFQGEWKHSELNNRIIVSDNEVNTIHYGILDNKSNVSEINTFYFAFDDNENLVVTNSYSQPRYILTIDESKRLEVKHITGDDVDIYEKISDITDLPEVPKEPKIGMSETDVTLSTWGYTSKKNITTTAQGTKEQWVYGRGYIYFENGIVTAIQEK